MVEAVVWDGASFGSGVERPRNARASSDVLGAVFRTARASTRRIFESRVSRLPSWAGVPQSVATVSFLECISTDLVSMVAVITVCPSRKNDMV